MFWAYFKTQPKLDRTESDWIQTVFVWSQHQWPQAPRPLVLPNNDFFPGKAQSAGAMAQLIFEQVLEYSGQADQNWLLLPVPQAMPAERVIFFEPELVREPQSLIADLVYQLALHELSFLQGHPSGDPRQVAEIIAIDWGFGLFFANSAFMLPAGGCCASPVIKRNNALSQWHYTEALALFCAQQGMDYVQVKPWLKKSLRSFFKARLKHHAIP